MEKEKGTEKEISKVCVRHAKSAHIQHGKESGNNTSKQQQQQQNRRQWKKKHKKNI